MVRAIEGKARENNDGKEVVVKQLLDQKEAHMSEIAELSSEYEQSRVGLMEQIESLNERNNDLDLKFKLLKAESEKEIENLKTQLEAAEILRKKAVNQANATDSDKLKLFEAADLRHKD